MFSELPSPENHFICIIFVLYFWNELHFSIASFSAFFFVALLLGKKPKTLHDRILVYWLVYLGLFTGLYLFSSLEFFDRIKQFPAFIVSLFLLHGPFLYLYTSALTLGKRKLVTQDFLHFLPFLIFVLYLLIASRFPGYSAGIRLDHVSTHIRPPLFFVFLLLMTVASGPLYFILSIVRVQKHKREYMDNISTAEKINLNWLRILLYIFGIIWTFLIIIAVTHHIFHYSSIHFCINGLLLSLSAFIVLVGYYGLKQKEIFVHFTVEYPDHHSLREYTTVTKEKYSSLFLSEKKIAGYVKKINRYMEQEKPFLNPDLTLPLLASELAIPAHHLSRVINEQFERNFFDFINGYRVEEVKKKLLDPAYDNFSLLGIAFEYGFNSKSAFNRIFKKTTGLTPSEYKKSQA